MVNNANPEGVILEYEISSFNEVNMGCHRISSFQIEATGRKA
jgi:hypothetical protein